VGITAEEADGEQKKHIYNKWRKGLLFFCSFVLLFFCSFVLLLGGENKGFVRTKVEAGIKMKGFLRLVVRPKEKARGEANPLASPGFYPENKQGK